MNRSDGPHSAPHRHAALRTRVMRKPRPYEQFRRGGLYRFQVNDIRWTGFRVR